MVSKMTNNEFIEIGKMLSDLFKVIISLDTAMLGLIIALVEKVFSAEEVFKSRLNKRLFGVCLISFVFSLVFSLYAIVIVPKRLIQVLQGGNLGLWFSD